MILMALFHYDNSKGFNSCPHRQKTFMPIYYEIDNARKRIYSRCEGVITYEDLRAHMNAEEGSPTASYSEILDCTDATTNISKNQIVGLAAEREEVAIRQKPGPVAIVAGDNNFFDKFLLFDSMTEQIRPIQIFRHAAAAERWLDEITRRWGDE